MRVCIFCFCYCAVQQENRADVVANAAGQRATPCIVSFHDKEEVCKQHRKHRKEREREGEEYLFACEVCAAVIHGPAAIVLASR